MNKLLKIIAPFGKRHAGTAAGIRLLMSVLFVTSFACSACAQNPHYTPAEATLRKDIAEMLIVGFRGTELTDTNRVLFFFHKKENHIVRDIRDYGIGGVILFEYDAPSGSRPRNVSSPAQLRELCHDLQAISPETLFISIDQEGGRVNRLKKSYGFPEFMSPECSAQMGDESVRQVARSTAQTLHSMGINLNFAPCVDVNVNPDCPVIGKLERSFSPNPHRVAACAKIWIEEQAQQGVLSCLKHFPGHGSSRSDTHAGLADVTDTWQPIELTPYRELIQQQTELPFMIMTTHVFNAHLDSLAPATLSPAILTTLLRDSLHYQGLVITDDLAMGAMTNQYPYEEILERAILAGADILCLSNNGREYNADVVPETIELIYQLVKSGKIDAQRIHHSAACIRKLKSQLSSAQ